MLGEITPPSDKLIEGGSALSFAESDRVPKHPPHYCGDCQIHEVLFIEEYIGGGGGEI